MSLLFEAGSEDKTKTADKDSDCDTGAYMRKMTAKSFKAKCLKVIDEVHSKHVTVIITKRGKPVAKLVPVGAEKDEIYGFFAGKGRVVGDVVSPAVPLKNWGDLK
jgi:prevent-host-death family protein